jgi:fatty acid desaturase
MTESTISRPTVRDSELASVRAAVRGEVEHGSNEAARRAAAARALIARGLEPSIAALRQPNAWVRARELVLFGAMWAAGGWLVLAGLHQSAAVLAWALRITGTLIAALALHVFALLLHDGVHHTLFRDRRLNRWVSVLLGGCAFISFSAYQTLHERHHVFLGDPRDPDDYHNYSGDRRLVWLMHYVRLLFGSFLYILLIPVVIARRGNARDKQRVGVEYGVLALLYAAVWLTVPHVVLVHCWLIPFVPAGLMFNLRSLAAHGIGDTSDPFLASRSIDANPVVAFLFRNENFHLEHHLFPEVPSYNLKALHGLVFHRMPRAATAPSYIGFLAQFVRQSLRLDESPIGVVSPANGDVK